MKKRTASLIIFLLLSVFVHTSKIALAAAVTAPQFLEQYLDSPEQVGAGSFRQLFWEIYDASLFAPKGEFSADGDFALQIEYRRDLADHLIVDKSIELISAQGISNEEQLEEWKRALDSVIPDVKKGDQLTGLRLQKSTYIYLNGERLGEISDSELSRYFFDIWLGEDTIAPELRLELLGQNSP